MKKVFVAVNSLEFGGIQKSLVSFLNYIKGKAEVDLLVWDHDSGVEIPAWVNLLNLPTVQSVKKAMKMQGRVSGTLFLSILASCKKKRWTLVPAPRGKYDIAIAYSHVGLSKYYVIDRVNAKKKYAFYHNGAYSFDEKIKLLDREYYKKYTTVFAVSQHIKKLLHQDISSEIHVDILHNLVDREAYLKLAEQENVPMDIECGLKILTVGRLSSEKNPLALVAVAKELRQIGIDFKWYIVGDGPLRQALLEKVQENELEKYCVLCGSQKNPYRFMKRCDVYVQLSEYEAEPITIQEVAIFGKPMVLSNIEGFLRYANYFDNILLVDGFPEKIARGILKMHGHVVDNTDKLKQLQKETYRKIDELLRK